MRAEVWLLACATIVVGCGRVAYRAESPDAAASIDAPGIDAPSADATLDALQPDALTLADDARIDAADLDADSDAGPDAPMPPIDARAPVSDATEMDAFAPDAVDLPDAYTTPDAYTAPDGGRDGGRDASVGPHNVVFLTPLLPNADLGGLAGADATCARYAATGGFGGNFVAFLSTATVDARDRLGSAEGWVRPDGLPVARTQAELLAGNLIYPPSVDFAGVRNPPGAYNYFTGTALGGRVDPGQTCGDWTSTSGYGMGGHWDMTIDFWMSRNGISCGSPARLLCFQTDRRTAPSAPAPLTGRRIFAVYRPTVTETPDAACARGAAGLGATFRAFVATSTSSAAGRFTLDRWPWVNTRGHLVATSLEDLTTHGLWAPVHQASGAEAGFVMLQTGSNSVLTPATSSCLDWTSSSSAMTAPVSTNGYTAQRWFSGGIAQCSNPTHFLCLEE